MSAAVDVAALAFALAVTAALLQLAAAAISLRRAALRPLRRLWLPAAAGLVLMATGAVLAAGLAWSEAASDPGRIWESAVALCAAFALVAGIWRLVPRDLRRGDFDEDDADPLARTERLETLFRLSPDALLLCTADGIILDANDSAASLSGRSRDELAGRPATELIPELAAASLDFDTGAALAGEPGSFELRQPGGHRVWLDVRARRLELDEESLVLLSARDASPRRQLEEQMLAQELRLALVVDYLPALIWTADRTLRMTSARGKGLDLIGMSAPRITGSNIAALAGTPAGDKMIERHRRALAGESVAFRYHYRGRMLEGVMASAASDDLPPEVVGIALDVTDRVQAENEAKAVDLRLHEILEHAPVMVLIKDLDLRVTYVNREWEKVTGYPRASAIGKRAGDELPSAVAAEGERQDRETLERRTALTFTEGVGHGVRRRSFSSVKFPLQNPDGTPYAVCALIREVTDRVRMEEELRRRASLLDEVQAMAHLASWEADLETERRYWSPNLYTMLGLDPSIGPEKGYDAYLAAIPDDERQEFLDHAFARFAEGSSYRFEHRIRRPDGTLRWLRVQGRIDRDESGAAVRVYGFAQDTTVEHEASREMALLNERLEETVARRTGQFEYARKELAAFSYAVSHDLRQPLRAIAGYVALMDEEIGASLPKPNRDCLDRVRLAARRMDATIDALLALTRLSRATLHRRDIDATAMAREIAAELAVAEPQRKVDWQIEPGLSVHADSDLFRIVLQNLLGNAFKFTRGQGAAHIAFGSEHSDGTDVLFVRDDGAGFEAVAARRLFQPFQRMHASQDFEGTGIGLATVARILQRHGGWIRAESKAGEGATFRFGLPAAADTETA